MSFATLVHPSTENALHVAVLIENLSPIQRPAEFTDERGSAGQAVKWTTETDAYILEPNSNGPFPQ